MGNKINKLKIYLQNKVTLVEFFRNYYGIFNNSFKHAKHEDIRRLMPNARRCSFEFVRDNQHLVCNGTIIMVEDSYGRLAPYINPLREGLFFVEEQPMAETPEEGKTKFSTDDVEAMPTYKLRQGMHQESNYKHYKNARIIKKELFDRGALKKHSRRRLIEIERRKEEYD